MKRCVYYLAFIILNLININKALCYDITDTPAMIALKYIGRHSYIGISSGINYTFHKFTFDSIHTKLLIKDKKELFIYHKLEGSTQTTKEKFRLFRFLWPREVYFKMDPESELKSWAEGAVQEMSINEKGEKIQSDNRSIATTSLSIPLTFSYIYEFDSKKFRLGIDPTFSFVRTSAFIVKTIPKANSNSKVEKLATIALENVWSTNLELPITFHYRMVNSKILDVFLFLSAGALFSSWNIGKDQPFFYRLWNVGLILEYPDKVNFKPFLKFKFQNSSFLESRISKDKKITPIIFNNKAFAIEFGCKFRIFPNKSRCGIPNCNIRYDHVHGNTDLRGRSYFDS